MAKTPKKKSEARSLRTYLGLSFIAAVFVGLFVFYGTGGVTQAEGAFQRTLIWSGLTFITSLVTIATLALTVKENPGDPNEPMLK
ncbi:MAG: hypothetical protein RIS82_425 [Actinomycetota bacterium]|jgi:VIT1/CCC1 family predicted Fe2+/Mn2+ transporter